MALAAVLKFNRSLKKLSLKGNPIGSVGATALRITDRMNPVVTIEYDGAEGPQQMPAVDLSSLPRMMQNMMGKALNLWGSNIGNQGVMMVAQMSNQFPEINLGNVGLGPEGLRALLLSLMNNTTTKNIDISGCQMDPMTAGVFGQLLKVNHTLESITADNCNIGNMGVPAIAGGLTMNQGLKTLSLEAMVLKGSGAVALAQALKTNQTLKNLSLSGNNLGPMGAAALAKVFGPVSINPMGAASGIMGSARSAFGGLSGAGLSGF